MGYFSIKELGLPENSWSAFETHHHTVPCPPGKLIYLQGSPADRFYYLKSGRVKVFINSEDGSEKILTVYEAGNVFGEASFFDELPRVSSAITVTRCEIVVIDRPTLEEEMRQNPQILLTITRVLARTVRMLSDHVDTMAFLRADQRIARYLLSVPEDEEHVIHCTQEEIAAAVEKLFGVHVLKVNTINVKPKTKRVRYVAGQTRSWKKAIVTVAEGDSIELFAQQSAE